MIVMKKISSNTWWL